ncbi:MAG TPA: carbohydrate ABC transporter permease [Thermomicrobiales bacterium]|nr:carbohydrate ABC transporter permease [Thermomicrobiales bacterium]
MAQLTINQQLQRGDAKKAKRAKRNQWIQQKIVPRLILVIMCLVFILPFYWMATLALKSNEELAIYPPTLYPHDPQWGNFKASTEVFPFWEFARNTMIVTVFTIIGAVISNPIIAYGFSRLTWPGRDKVFLVVLATVFMPFPVIIVALVDIYARFGWINTFLPLIVPMFFGNAFWIFLVRQFMLQIPMDLSDAARVDGANEWQIFWQIVMPQCIPAIGVVAIFSGLHAWNDFIGPLIFLTSEKLYTLPIGLTFFQSTNSYDVRFNLMMAASTLVVLPLIVLFLLFQKSFIGGLSVGSIK